MHFAQLAMEKLSQIQLLLKRTPTTRCGGQSDIDTRQAASHPDENVSKTVCNPTCFALALFISCTQLHEINMCLT